MADWNEPRPGTRSPFGGATINGDLIGAGARDEGLRRYMLSIYNYMASGVLLTGVVALLFATSGMAAALFGTPLRWLVALAPLGFIMAMSFGLNRMQTGTLKALFWAFCVVMGMSMSSIFFIYTGSSIALTFFATAGAFAGLSLYGYTTKRNLSAMGAFMVMGLVGIILAMLLNLFLQSSGLALAISVLGVLIFAGLTAWDTQRLRETYFQVHGTDMVQKVIVMGALSLYLDFINLFQYLLSFLGDRR
ncbi:Bax inhibitor-1/YccA family protein [Novosphingobium sp.]|uniref:Bax inhibitor-1/YccA family protein n=1 Tax=Novosphingobium sp. TaxID=1874826 RepID=UPI0025F949D9|nr:Bax inhibitor-1/YccA family protein [Novosphingobium sp.]MCC6925114.1 Bax inhibitor-1/YccA family protein [Novosphingobium sp.]